MEDLLQEEWTYIGHGEWAEPEHRSKQKEEGPLEWDPEWVHKWRCSVDRDLQLHELVLKRGYPNRWGAQIPVESKWNLELFADLLKGYHDNEVVEWLRCGWPTGRLPTLPDPATSNGNHKGAKNYPKALKTYIAKETRKGAVMGPYKRVPFRTKVGLSPLSTRPKRDSPDRCIILDLSFPPGRSINDGIMKDDYMGIKAKLHSPKSMNSPSGYIHWGRTVSCSKST